MFKCDLLQYIYIYIILYNIVLDDHKEGLNYIILLYTPIYHHACNITVLLVLCMQL